MQVINFIMTARELYTQYMRNADRTPRALLELKSVIHVEMRALEDMLSALDSNINHVDVVRQRNGTLRICPGLDGLDTLGALGALGLSAFVTTVPSVAVTSVPISTPATSAPTDAASTAAAASTTGTAGAISTPATAGTATTTGTAGAISTPATATTATTTVTTTALMDFPQFGGQLKVARGPPREAFYARGAHLYFSPCAGVTVRVPQMVVRDGSIDFTRARSVRCKHGTLRECAMLRGYRECNFAHVGEKYVRIGYPTRCTTCPTIGNAETLCKDVVNISKKDMLVILAHGLSDVMVALAWYSAHPTQENIDDIDVVR
jgi:hypothetical protein